MVKFVLIHIIVIYHTIPFIDIHIDLCQFAPLFNDLLVMKIVTVSNLCLTYVILFILVYLLGHFGSQTTFNDSCLIQFILYLTKMMGE